METVKTKANNHFYPDHKDGIKVVQVEDTKEFLVLDDGYVSSIHSIRIQAEQAAAQIKLEGIVSDALDEAIGAAARNVFESIGTTLTCVQKAELLNASCTSLMQLYFADAEQERRSK